ADHRWPIRASRIEDLARALAARLGLGPAGASDIADQILDAVASDLRSAGPAALIIAGEHQPAAVHRLAHGMNAALGAFRHTVDYIPSPEFRADREITLAELIDAAKQGDIGSLLILGQNPV